MAIAVAQAVAGTLVSSPTSVSESFASTPAITSLIVAVLKFKHSSIGPPSWTIADNQGNTYTLKVEKTGARTKTFQWFVNLPASSGTFTVTATPDSATTGAAVLDIFEVTGHDTSAPDEAVNSNNSSGTAVDSLSVAPAGNALYIAACTAQTISQTITEESESWTVHGESEGGQIVHSTLYKVTSGSINGNWTLGTGGNWSATITAWKEASAGATDDKDNPNEWAYENFLNEDSNDLIVEKDTEPWDEMGDLDTPTLPEFQCSVDLDEVDIVTFDNYDSSAWSWDNPSVVVDNDILYQYDAFVEQAPEQFDNVEHSGWSWENPPPVVDSEVDSQTADYFDPIFEINDVYYPTDSELYTDLPELLEPFDELYVRNIPIELGQLVLENNYIGTWLTLGGSGVLAANQIYYVPIRVAYNTKITEIGINVITASSALARIGIYFNNRGQPSDLIYQNVINLNTAGFRPILCNLNVEAGTYWLAFLQNVSAASIAIVQAIDTPILGVDNPGIFNINQAYKQAYAYAALPSEATPEGYVNFSSGIPHMRVRIS